MSYPLFQPLTLTPGGTGTITWMVKVQDGGTLLLDGSARGIDTCSGAPVASTATQFGPLYIRCADIHVSAAAPAFVHPGMTFTVTITAFNAGTEPAMTVAPFAFSAYAEPWVLIAPFRPPRIGRLDPGATAYFAAVCTAMQPGRLLLNSRVIGTACHYAMPFSAPTVTVFIGQARLTVVEARGSPGGVCPGESIHAVFTVSNTGDGYAKDVRIGLPTVTGTGGVALSGALSATCASLPSGRTWTFTLTYTGTSPGRLAFTVSAMGIDANTGVFVTSPRRTSNTVRVSDNTMTVAVVGSGPVSVGATVFVVETVTNTSGVNAYWVRPTLTTVGPPAVMLSTPSPASVTMLGDGASRTFTWKCRVDSWGVLTLGASATATICSASLTFTGTGRVLVGKALLAGTGVTVIPGSPCPGQIFEVVLGVRNTGDAAVAGVMPGTPVVEVVNGAAEATHVTSPLPLPLLAPGASASFTWGYEAGPGTGTLRFLIGASGTDPVSGKAVSIDPVLSDPVVVSRQLYVTASYPNPVTRGVPFDLVLNVTNPTPSPAVVSPNPMYIPSGASLLSSQSGPVPPFALTLTPGGSGSFTWTYVTNGMGVVVFNPSVAAAACGMPGAQGPGDLAVTSFNGEGDWPVWGHDAQHTFRQAGLTPLEPPLEEVWSVPRGTCPVVAGDLSFWLEGSIGSYDRLVARRVIDGAEVWHVAGTFSPGLACDNGLVYVMNNDGGRHVESYGVGSSAPVSTFHPPYGVDSFTVESGKLYAVSATGLSIYGGSSTFTRAASDFPGVTSFLVAPPLVVAGDMVVIGVGSGNQLPRLIRTGTSSSPFNQPIDVVPWFPTPNSHFLMYDGTFITVAGHTGGDAVVKAYNPANGVAARSFTWANGNEFYGPVLAPNGDLVVRRGVGWSDALGVGYAMSSSVRLSPLGSGYTPFTTDEPLWWSGSGRLSGRNAAANGYVYHLGHNAALAGSGSVRPIMHAVNLADNSIVWSPTAAWDPVLPDAMAPAIARGLVFMDGGHVFGPRTIDPPSDLVGQSARYGADLTWSAPVLGANDVAGYELYRAESVKGQIWASAFQNPAVTPAPVLVTSTEWLSFNDTGLTPGQLYWYAVRAVTQSGRPPTSWFSAEQAVIPGGPVAQIAYPGNCDVAGGFVTVVGKAFYWGYPNQFSRYTILVDGVIRYTSYVPRGNPYSGAVSLGTVPVPPTGCHAVTLVVHETGGATASASSVVAANPGPSCPGCTGRGAVFTFSEHRHPEGIAADRSDFVYVVDSLRRRVERYDAEGRLLWEIGAGGGDTAGLQAPAAAAVAPDGRIFVADKLRKQVVVYDEDGGFLYGFGGAGAVPGRFQEPSGIALDARGGVWVSDRITGRLQRFTQAGELAGEAHTTGAYTLKGPRHVWVEASGTVWVADGGHDRVCAFDQDGHGLRSIEGGLAQPGGVAVDATGRRVFIADTGHDRIGVFSADAGAFMWSFGSSGMAAGELRQPGGLALDTQTSVLYVADTLNDRGQAWPLRLSAAPDLIPPRAELSQPPSSVERGTVLTIRGRAVDAHFAKYRLTLTGGGTSSVVVESTGPVWLGELGTIRTAEFAPGGYRLELVVEDRAGKVGRDSRFLAIVPKPEPLVAVPEHSPASR